MTLTLKIATTTTKKYSAWHSGSWCCIIIPNLLTKCSVIQKISSGRTITDIFNLCCDLQLERSNPIFQQDTLAWDDVPSDQVWLPRNQQFRKYGRKSHILILWALAVTLTLKIATTTTTNIRMTLAHDAASPYQIWWQNVLWFRKFHPDKHSLTFRTYAVTLTLNLIFPRDTQNLWCFTIEPSLVANRPAV